MSDQEPTGPSIQDPLNTSPPNLLMERKIVCRPGQVNTVRVMHDPRNTDRSRWFAAGARRILDGNEVKYFVRGDEAYADMVDAMSHAANFAKANPTANKAIIYILGWDCDMDIPLIPGNPSSNLKETLRKASACGVEIRAMLWANVKGTGGASTACTATQVQEINTLPTGRAILDAKTGLLAAGPVKLPIRKGSHHQKVVIVHSDKGLVAYCGGVDFAVTRIDSTPGAGLQDVHCSLRGPAAHELLTLFVDRWEDYINTPVYLHTGDHDLFPPRFKQTPLEVILNIPGKIDTSRDFLSASKIPVPTPVGRQVVQVGRTTPKGVYQRFHPEGEQSARKMILKAIGSAQKFIYMEEQYLLDLECADALANAAAKPGFKYIVIVIPDDHTIDPEFLGVASFHRAEFVKRLKVGAGAKKISLHCAFRFTHSKTYVIDDKYAIIGSANCNRRGWESDSEVVAGIFDESTDQTATLHFARRLRMKLWADHFNLAGASSQPNRPVNSQDEYAEVADGIAAAAHWRKRPGQAFSRPYFPLDHKGESAQQVLERSLRDKVSTNERAAQFRLQVEILMASGVVHERDLWDAVIDPPSPL